MEQRSTIPDDVRIHREIESGYETLAHQKENGGYELSVLVGGVHCAGCIQKIESSLAKKQDIDHARLNFSTGRLSMAWHGKPEQANDYVGTVEKLGYTVHPYNTSAEQNETERQERFLLLCLGVAGFAMGNIMLLSVGLWATSAETMGMATRDFMHWVSAVIAVPTILFSGRVFFRSAFSALAGGHANMDVPISLALILASGMSLFETINHGEHVYFDSAVMLMFFLLIGRYLDFRARKNARSVATGLLSTLSGFATVIESGKNRRVSISDLREEMIVRVNSGEKFPVDGIVTEGRSEVDTSLVTGETLPRLIEKGNDVFAGTMNLSAPVMLQVARAAEDSLLSDIVRLMEQAGQGQDKYVRIADRAARFYTPVVHTLAAAAFLGWLFIGGIEWQPALMIAITVLIITCPCALGLAVPVVQVLATGRLMKEGILVKSGDALERLATIDMVAFDKTGTLTEGHPALEGTYDPEKLALAASLAVHSSHPLSKSLSGHYGGDLLPVSEVKEHPGQGLEGTYNGKTVRLGSRAWCGDSAAPASGKTELWLDAGNSAPFVFYFADRLRDDAAMTVKQLAGCGVTSVMLSGDREAIAGQIAGECGIEKVFAEKTPPEKFAVMEEFKKDGHKVLMVGDGLNDAPVLAGADVSIAPGTAIDIAQNAADIVFMGDKLRSVYETYRTACVTQNLVRQNFTLAVLYNVIAVPLAFAGFVTPLVAALAMSGSSLLVIANSFRLRLMV